MHNSTSPPPSGRDSQLRAEARHFHVALFSEPPPASVEEGYVQAHRYYCPPDADRIDLPAIVAGNLDVEALELVLRRRHPVLTRKLRILVYLSESTPSGYARLVNRKSRPLQGWLDLAGAVLRTVYKWVKGLILLRTHRIAYVIVVGSGPAGVFAARELRPLRVLMLDAGLTASGDRLPDEHLDALRTREDMTQALLGERFEALHNVDRGYLSPKLKGPLMRFITDSPPGDPGFMTDGFTAVTSHARGGLANAWGAVVCRYDDDDLAGFPVTAAELAPCYDELTRHIGVSGSDDDLTPFFGSTADLQPPLPLSRLARRFLDGYGRRPDWFHRRGIRLGRLRSAILTRDHDGRPAHRLLNQEFYQPNLGSVYHPGYTLAQLTSAGQVNYLGGRLVLRYRELEQGVEVTARNIETGEAEVHTASHVVLAAGALGSARIVLASHDDRTTELPVLDSLLSYVPLLDLRQIGAPLDTDSYSASELCVLYRGPLAPEPVQALFYGLSAPLKGDLFSELPLSARGNLVALRYLLPAMAMLQLFYPEVARPGNRLRLAADGKLAIRYQPRSFGVLERHFIASFRRLGFLGAASLCQYPLPGSSMHYAGTLPMKERPSSPYECDRYGRLSGSGRVRVADGAALPALASKNHTFTIMANAMRIARHLRESAT